MQYVVMFMVIYVKQNLEEEELLVVDLYLDIYF